MMMITKACENFLSFDEMNISIEWGILGQLWEHLTIAPKQGNFFSWMLGLRSWALGLKSCPRLLLSDSGDISKDTKSDVDPITTEGEQRLHIRVHYGHCLSTDIFLMQLEIQCMQHMNI